MNDDAKIPVLTDLIEKGIEITLSDLGLEEGEMQLRVDDDADEPTLIDASVETAAADLFAANPGLEQTIRRILDEHMELALQEIKLAIRQALDRS